MTFWAWLQKSRKRIPGRSIWWLSSLGSRSQQNESQEAWFDDFLNVDKTSPRRLELITFQPWFKKPTKPAPGSSIWWLSGFGSRHRENQPKEAWFDNFLVMASEVDQTSPRRLDLMIFWPRIQKSTKQRFSWIVNDPENSSWETFRVALGNENYWFCLAKQWFS